jgi:O-antigen/teichoic acid export membrane protein
MALVDLIKVKIKNPLLQRMIIYAFSDGLSKAIPFLIFPLVAAFLTTAEFGYVANFGVLTQIVLALVILNAHTYLTVDYYKIDESSRNGLLQNILLFLLINTLFVLIIVLLIRSIIEKYLSIDFFWQIAAVFWALGMAAIYVLQAYLRIEEKTKMFAYYQIVQAAFSATLTFILVVTLEYGLEGRLYSLLISVLIFGLFGYLYLVKASLFNLKKKFKFNLKPIYFFGLPLLPHTISFWVKGGIDKIYITKFISISATGIYAFAETFMLVFTMFSLAFFSAYTPHLFKTIAQITEKSTTNDIDKIKLKVVKETSAFVGLFAILLVVGYASIYLFIKYFFFDKFGDSLQYLHLLIACVFVSIIYSVFSSYLFYLKNTKVLGIINFSGAVVHTLINYFVIQSFGIKGLISTNLIMLSLTTSIIIYQSEKSFPMPWRKIINRN